MPRGKQSRGQCIYCEHETTKGAMTKHLSGCQQRQELIAQAGQQRGPAETLHHLRVQDAWGGRFWLDLEMRSSATLADLDDYLRAIWLECCGHLSRFSIGGWRGEEISMNRRADAIFKPGLELNHIYDFGTESVTLVKVIGLRRGNPTTTHPLALMARNVLPEYRCIECEEAAAWLCNECMYEENVWGALCEAHVQTHPHDDYGEPVPLVNSPRLGMCGYAGPAEPPY